MGGSVLEEAKKKRSRLVKTLFFSTDHSYYLNGGTT
jgi:hypothetical protein